MNAVSSDPRELTREALVDRFRSKYWQLQEADAEGRGARGSETGRAIRILQFSSVVAPLDGGRYAEHALPWAMGVAASAKIPLVLESAPALLGKFENRLALALRPGFIRRETPVEDYFRETAADIATQSINVVPRPRETPVTDEQLSEIAPEDQLIVVADRPRRTRNPFRDSHLIGRLLRCGASPLIVVRGYRWRRQRQAKMVKHLVVVLDGTDESERILPSAVAIAEATGAVMTLLRVVPATPYYGIPSAEKELEASAYLQSIQHAARQRRIVAYPAVWSSEERPGEVILSWAQRHNADLIAMAVSLQQTHAGTLRRQTAHYLIRKSRIPLLMVNADKSAQARR